MMKEGLKIARLLMVLSSISPLFIFWAIKGSSKVPDEYFIGICALLIFVPNICFWLRIRKARKHKQYHPLTISNSEDHREHLLVYLFAMLLPFYAADMDSWRSMTSAFTAVLFIVFLFYHLNLHYMNIIFAAKGYRIFTVFPDSKEALAGYGHSSILITKRNNLPPGLVLKTLRVSDTVFLEE